MSKCKDHAIQINKDTYHIIAEFNDGVMPVHSGGYFIYAGSPNKHNLMLTSKDFHKNFKFIREQLHNQFAEVREIK